MTATLRTLTYAVAMAAALAGSGMTPVATYAASDSNNQSPNDQVVQASQAGTAQQSLKLSQDGYNVMRDVRAARLAIFNGDTDAAKQFVEDAKADLNKAKTDATVVKSKNSEGNKGNENEESTQAAGNWIPIDGELMVADNFVSTPEKTEHIKQGNQKLKEGKTEEAMQHLNLAEVDIGFTRLLMPLDKTEAHINQAADLIENEKYYQANVALKAAEEGLNLDTVMLVGLPKSDQQGTSQKSADHNQQQSADQQSANQASK